MDNCQHLKLVLGEDVYLGRVHRIYVIRYADCGTAIGVIQKDVTGQLEEIRKELITIKSRFS